MGETLDRYELFRTARSLAKASEMLNARHNLSLQSQIGKEEADFIPRPLCDSSVATEEHESFGDRFLFTGKLRPARINQGGRRNELLERIQNNSGLKLSPLKPNTPTSPTDSLRIKMMRRSQSQSLREKVASSRSIGDLEKLPRGQGPTTERIARPVSGIARLLLNDTMHSAVHRDTMQSGVFSSTEERLLITGDSMVDEDYSTPSNTRQLRTPPHRYTMQSVSTPPSLLRRVHDYYEVLIPRTDRGQLSRVISGRQHEYDVIEATLRDCLNYLNSVKPKPTVPSKQYMARQRRSVIGLSRTDNLRTIKGEDFANATTAAGSVKAQCRRTIDRVSLFPQTTSGTIGSMTTMRDRQSEKSLLGCRSISHERIMNF